MKKIAIVLLKGSLGFLFSYLYGSFYTLTFDISNWTELVRLAVVLFGAVAFIMLAFFTDDELK